jgi:hypothetical protein
MVFGCLVVASMTALDEAHSFLVKQYMGARAIDREMC